MFSQVSVTRISHLTEETGPMFPSRDIQLYRVYVRMNDRETASNFVIEQPFFNVGNRTV